MMGMLSLATALASMTLMWTLNPIKMCMNLLILSALIFSMMFKMNGSSWFPIIFFMLMMGGILIMFMIISSILPNEKSIKMKKISIMALLSIYTMSKFKSFNESSNWSSQLKMILNNTMNLSLMLMIILGYFLAFTMMTSTEKNPLRSI